MRLLCLLVVLCTLCGVAFSNDTISGVNLGGWLLIEEWMFSFGMFDRVDELYDTPQGVVMPPLLPDGFGQNWFGEGDLVYKLVQQFGEDSAIEVIEAHRDEYITDDDLMLMRLAGIEAVRVPLGWWALVDECDAEEAVVITDPAHADKQFVTVPRPYLLEQISRIVDNGLEVLLDIHAFPGGSTEGSYNGIFPADPVFFTSDDLMAQGFDIVTNLCDLYLDLPASTRAGVTGFTLMNEPAQGLGWQSDFMQAWLRSATDIYRQKIANFVSDVPKLYTNLIGNSITNEAMLIWMDDTFTEEELADWAVLDVHSYYAWDWPASGCYDGSCAYECSDSATAEGLDHIHDIVWDTAEYTHTYFVANGTVPMVACTEYSLATLNLSNTACRSKPILDEMYYNQLLGFEEQGLYASFFWTWRMPYGGTHEYAWSLKYYLGLGH
ncbi:hypothetical protein KIPB_002989 [Kipferlia bialata]|uniref:glucan 1,3-beta-glucosidase n=1 Tax=Kipferlia bialata TaxID=797122 RepID=A0A9K3GGN4_9EUKA|nr:hypothetical protein KIPB_002989 [Kipferlia bialata]|eukprot:g2989.t1